MTEARRDWLASEFERHRARLRAIAYRMLGSVAEADDAVQEAWLRLDRHDPGGTKDLRGWLTVVVGRICLDMLRARMASRTRLAGSWLPEPVVWTDEDPEHDALMADSVGMALLIVLESLAPPERLAFVLHDVFGVPFEEIAPVVERSPQATRQLASRARRRVRAKAREPDAEIAVQRHVVDAFLAAARDGDFDSLLRLLHPDVIVRIDGGPDAPRQFARACIAGAQAVARETRNFREVGARFEPVIVNGGAGLLVRFPARMLLWVFTVVDGKVAEIDLIADPDKLHRVPPPRRDYN